MRKIILMHWNAEEAEARAKLLRAAGYQVSCRSSGAEAMASLREDPPDAFVIDLSRIPSQGRDIAVTLRQRKPTRRVPIVFIEGASDKTESARRVLPDAMYTPWPAIAQALETAIKHPPADPVVPGSMDAYAGTPLPQKLGIKTGSIVTLLGAPRGLAATLGDLPEGARLRSRASGEADIALLFVKTQTALERDFVKAAGRVKDVGRLWICWPKKAAQAGAGLAQPAVRAYGLSTGWVDFKISSIDDTWSGLCFTRRQVKKARAQR